MSRYIDADLIEYEPMCRARGNGMYEDCEIAHKDQIDDIPTAEIVIPVKQITDAIVDKYGEIAMPSADVVEVVRCKDCKHGRDAVRGSYKHKLNLIDCNRIDYEHPYIMRPNDFCSWGEREEE